jgi:hypothetical protein
MYIAFEISDPMCTKRRGDIKTQLSPDRVNRGMIKYVLAIPIFQKTIYLKRNAHCDCHYGLWSSEIVRYIAKAKDYGIDVLVVDKNEEVDNDFRVMHGNKCAEFQKFPKLLDRCKSNQITNEELTMDENRNTMSDCFGFSTANYELDEETQVNKPAIKCNMNRYAGETMLVLGQLLDEVDSNGHFHKVNIQRQRNYAARIGSQCGMCPDDCRDLYLEGMTYNQTTICVNEWDNEPVSPTPHCGNNFLICVSWMQEVSANVIVRHVILGYMRRVISAAIKRGILADSVETVVTQYLAELPPERIHVCPRYILRAMNARCNQDDLFVMPCNMDKEAFYSLIVTDLCEYAERFNLFFLDEWNCCAWSSLQMDQIEFIRF